MIRVRRILLPLSLMGTLLLHGQQRADLRNTYERIFCIVPIIGKGTPADPRRPLHVPLLSALHPSARSGILGFQFIEADDGLALVEFVAADKSAFAEIVADPLVKAFLKGKDSRATIETEFLKHKKDFNFNQFGVRMR